MLTVPNFSQIDLNSNLGGTVNNSIVKGGIHFDI